MLVNYVVLSLFALTNPSRISAINYGRQRGLRSLSVSDVAGRGPPGGSVDFRPFLSFSIGFLEFLAGLGGWARGRAGDPCRLPGPDTRRALRLPNMGFIFGR